MLIGGSPLLLSRMNNRFIACSFAWVLAVVLSGCQRMPTVDEVVTLVSKPFTATDSAPVIVAQPEPVDPIAEFAASAAPGENAKLIEPKTGRQVDVRAERMFNSASGERCRYLTLAEPSGKQWREIVCEHADDEWQRSKVVARTARRRGAPPLAQN